MTIPVVVRQQSAIGANPDYVIFAASPGSNGNSTIDVKLFVSNYKTLTVDNFAIWKANGSVIVSIDYQYNTSSLAASIVSYDAESGSLVIDFKATCPSGTTYRRDAFEMICFGGKAV